LFWTFQVAKTSKISKKTAKSGLELTTNTATPSSTQQVVCLKN
jgi:hypothetical protein